MKKPKPMGKPGKGGKCAEAHKPRGHSREMKHIFSIPDHTGDTRHEFDLADPADRAKADAMFAELVGQQKHWAGARYADGTIVRALDPNSLETSFHRQLGGG